MVTENEFVTKEDLEQLLAHRLGPQAIIETFTVSPLTKPGENYGSNILAVDVILQHPSEKLSLVVKLVPISPFLRQVFRIGVTVRKEIDTYLLVSPEYEKIQRENNIPDEEFLDVYPTCYGARATKDKDVGQPADEGSAIVLENLKVKGYECGDRIQGFDLIHTEYIVKHLARFHATAVAIKLKKPDVFEKTVKKSCVRVPFGSLPKKDGVTSTELDSSVDLIKSITECSKYADTMKKVMEDFEKTAKAEEAPLPREPFASIHHADFWTNNMMLTYQNTSNKNILTGFKIVDFQVSNYDSPAKDLLFFLYTSTKVGLLEKHFDDLIRLYHSSFVEWLNKLDCDVKPFTLEKFKEEVEHSAPQELAHIFFMLRPICLKRENARDLANFNNELFESSDVSSLSETFVPKMTYLLNDFSRRSWLQIMPENDQ